MERQPGVICIEWIGMVRPAGWSGCSSSPTVLPSRRGALLDVDRGSLLDADQHPDRLSRPLLPNPMAHASVLPPHRLGSLYWELFLVPDFRRAQCRKHTIASVLAIIIAARLAGIGTGIGAAQFAQALNQTELESLGVWFNPKKEQYEPPLKSIIYRVLEMADPAAIETVLNRWSTP